MAPKGMAVSVTTIVAVVAVLLVAVSAQTPSTDCTSSATTLLPCYTYVTGPGSTPPSTCCQGLTSLNTNNPVCLCQLITQQLNSTAGVNVTKAYSLPKDCGVTIDSKTCPALASIMAPPSGSPAVAGPGAAPAGPGSAPGAVPPGTGAGSCFSPSRWVILASMLAVVGVQSSTLFYFL